MAAAVSGVLVLVLILFTVGPPAPAPVTLPQVETPVQQPAPPVPDPRIQELERYTQEHPNVYDLTSYTAHTELRNLYSLADPSEKIQAMEETDFILEHWPMDPVALHSLAVWPGERAMNITLMQVSLLKNVTDYPQFRFLAAASYLAVGDLYAKMGDYPHARAFYDLVSGDHSSDLDQYRRLARKRLDALGIGTPNR